jgi:hypothetical protein
MFKNKIYPINIKQNKNVYDTDDCSICLDKLVNKLIMPCGHQFHTDCILDWFKKNNTCPICRVKLKIIKKKL